MKIIMTVVMSWILFIGNTQVNYVVSGGELFNYGIVDLSLNSKISWSTDRSIKPGYFSVVENANFAGFSDAAHINGYVKKYGNTGFIFPVGNGKSLRAFEISSSENISDAFAVAWIEGDPSENIDPTDPGAGEHSIKSFAGSITQVSNVGQWDWQVGESESLGKGTTGNGNGLNIRVTIPDMRSFAEPSELRIVGWNGSQWIDLSGKPTATGNTEYSNITGSMIAGISAIGIGKVKDEYSYIENEGFLLYPNPVINYNNINARFRSIHTGTGQLLVYDAAGKLVIRKYVQYKWGINIISIEVKQLSNGTYYMNLFSAGGEKLFVGKRFIKQ
jgi:hypothetical protein